MQTLNLDLAERSYPIHIGPGLLGRSELIMPHIAGNSAVVVSNETVAPLYLERVLSTLSLPRVGTVILPDGEEYKTLGELDRIFHALLEQRFDRHTTLIALGGGVVGDMTGFAAAVYQRGIPFIQIPTTLLAQVDSSVGGKTGVNHALGKNMLGAFHQPRCVIADTDTLKTLDDRQLAAGIAEVIKYGLIDDPDFFVWLEEHIDSLLQRDEVALSQAIERSCRDKAAIVAADEHERGNRALLNLGHTFGHAIEHCTGYGNWLHGEAVATGMLVAACLSRRMGLLDDGSVERIRDLLQRSGLPTTLPQGITADGYLEAMTVDKKVENGKLRLILLRGIGEAFISDSAAPGDIRSSLHECMTSA